MARKRNSSNRKAISLGKLGRNGTSKRSQNSLSFKSDKFVDPTVLNEPERLAEFGRLILRAIERRRSETQLWS